MSLVVLDIECIESNIVKELGVYKDGQTEGYSFLPPKKFKPTSQSFWCTQHLHGINWSSGYEKYTELEKILKNLEATDTEFFAKGYEKWRCSNYPFRHAKTLHCAEKKAFAYGTWTRCFFNKFSFFLLFLMYYHFQTLIKFHCQLFLFRVKMVDQCDKPVFCF